MKKESGSDNPSRHAGMGTYLIVRASALLGLVAICVVGLYEVEALRGALAYKRFDLAGKAASEAETPEYFVSRVQLGSRDAGLLVRHPAGMPMALWEASGVCRRWASSDRVKAPQMKVQLMEKAVAAAARAVQGAPTDYLMWEQLARAQLGLALPSQAEAAIARAQELAPPGAEVQPSDVNPGRD